MKYLRFLLFPFSILYYLVTSVRNYLYDSSLVETTSFSLPIIVVGNLSVGGTGKTPQIEYLVRLLNNNYKTAILSRGYKRQTEGFIKVTKTHSVKDVGDEPLQYFKKFETTIVAVDKNRVEGVKKLISNNKPEVILLDDAYQHRKVKGSYYVLLTAYGNLFTDDFILPVGNLRESRKGAKRADIIVISKCPKNLKNGERKKIIKKVEKYCNSIYFSAINYESHLKGSFTIALDQLCDYEIVLVTGIANPKSLLSFLRDLNCSFKHLEFPDHYNFREKDIKTIQLAYDSISNKKKIILTTEKDYVRLQHKIKKLSYLAIQTSFLNDGKKEFDKSIIEHVKQFL